MPDKVKILIIDDEQVMRDGCTRILSRDGWTVITAENGHQGLDEIRRHPSEIDLILLDLMMPGLSGMETLERIREIDSNLLVVVITGHATVESAVEAMKKGPTILLQAFYTGSTPAGGAEGVGKKASAKGNGIFTPGKGTIASRHCRGKVKTKNNH